MELAELFAQRKIALQRGPIFDETPPPLPAASLRSRIRGMMLGLAIGDALGNTTESQTPARRRQDHGEIRHYLPNRYADWRRVGLPTDDTQLAFWTLEHLVERRRLDPEALADVFAERRVFGMGGTVRSFVANRREGRPWYECGPRSAGDGALMRIAPLLIPFVREPTAELWADTARAAMLTHNDPASTSACVAFVGILWDLLGREAPPAPEWWLDRYLKIARPLEGETDYRASGGAYADYAGPLWRFVSEHVREAHRAGRGTREACDRWYSGAYLLETVPCVLYLLMRHGHDPEEAIVRAVNDTHDNDTIGAIVGAAVGALHGEDRLPRRWRDDLLGRLGADDDGAAFAILERAERAFLPGE
ncbi:MAG: ADP-ribosylglycohydrolase family protein [Planctomycetota bacterium]|jgi:ADP-ribosylglycohydrolase